jgi:ATP-binding cassette subfamily B protein
MQEHADRLLHAGADRRPVSRLDNDVTGAQEAFTDVLSESEVAVQQALRTALAGRTSLVIAHRLSTVRDADLLLVLDEGRIVDRGATRSSWRPTGSASSSTGRSSVPPPPSRSASCRPPAETV